MILFVCFIIITTFLWHKLQESNHLSNNLIQKLSKSIDNYQTISLLCSTLKMKERDWIRSLMWGFKKLRGISNSMCPSFKNNSREHSTIIITLWKWWKRKSRNFKSVKNNSGIVLEEFKKKLNKCKKCLDDLLLYLLIFLSWRFITQFKILFAMTRSLISAVIAWTCSWVSA